jgi:transcriptional regulator with XRE-family HTH domain
MSQKMKQSDLSRLVGVTAPFISQIESGQSLGRLSLWFSLARMFNIPVEILLDPRPEVPSSSQTPILLPKYIDISRRTEEIMLIQGQSQQAMAIAIGTNQPNISEILRKLREYQGDGIHVERRDDILLDTLFRIAWSLHKSVPYLLRVQDRSIHDEVTRLINPNREMPMSNLSHLESQYLSGLIQRMRQLRTDHRLSKSELARQIKVSQPAISFLESGNHWPFLSTVIKFSNYFKLPVEILFDLTHTITDDDYGLTRPIKIEELGPKLAAQIESSGLSQDALARFINLSQPTVAITMRRLRSGPDIGLLRIFRLAWAARLNLFPVMTTKVSA